MAKTSKPKTLAEKIIAEIAQHKKVPRQNVYSVESSNGRHSLITILEVGVDYIEVKDDEGRIFSMPLSSAISRIRDVTGVNGFEWKGK